MARQRFNGLGWACVLFVATGAAAAGPGMIGPVAQRSSGVKWHYTQPRNAPVIDDAYYCDWLPGWAIQWLGPSRCQSYFDPKTPKRVTPMGPEAPGLAAVVDDGPPFRARR